VLIASCAGIEEDFSHSLSVVERSLTMAGFAAQMVRVCFLLENFCF
jgi:hypothetical protein